MFIERNQLNQLNKDLFGGGIYQTKKLIPDYERVVMPDPSLPKIKRFNISSNNPLGYLMNANSQYANQPPMVSQIQESVPPQEIVEQPEQQPAQDLYSNNVNEQEMEPQPQPQEEEMIPQEVPAVAPIEPEIEDKQYKITDLGENNILLPAGYSTDDEIEYKLINLINEPRENFSLVVDSKEAKVYKKEVNGTNLLKIYGTIPHPISKIKTVLLDTPGMDKWDKTYKKHEIIQKYPIENGMEKQIVYLYIKMPVFMTDREVVLEEKIWSEYNGNPQNFFKCQRSTTNSKYPVKEKPIRAEMIIGGMYLKEQSPQETLIYVINQFDLKMTTAKDLAASKSQEAAKEFIVNLTKQVANS